ncbi:unnamed protein product [Pylaiella littoralis]
MASSPPDKQQQQQQLWSEKHKQTANGTAALRGSGGDAPRDVASMKAEIAELQSGTTASLDRAIAAAQATGSIAAHTSTTLRDQRQQMGDIDAEARSIDGKLKQTGYNLKHGLTWRGALTSPFRRNKSKVTAAGGARGDISPVFKDDYTNNNDTSNQPTAPSHANNSRSRSTGNRSTSPKKTSLFKARAKAGAALAPAAVETPKVPEHAPDGFETQLDTLDGLLDGLNLQAKAIGAELKQQNDGIEALGARVEPLRQETASQAKQIKRRFGVKSG